MAGGEGVRLRAVSDGRPKPMVPLLGRPVIAYIVELLRGAGVTDICVTLKHMPEKITGFLRGGEDCGVRIESRVEKIPLGTAGGVKSCMDFVGDENFLVISGDAVCDFDLAALMRQHIENPCAVTMALYEHPEPLAYGTVLTDSDGRVLRFIEKPNWERVITDYVNTGIYVVSPPAMQLVPEGKMFDFAKDLFPLLAQRGELIRGVKMRGYWCDIGAPAAYRECVMAALRGEITLSPPYRGVPPHRTTLPADVKITPPVFLGANVRVYRGAEIGPNVAVEGRSVIGAAARLTNSVILDSEIGAGAELHGVTACPGARVLRGARVGKGVIISAREDVQDTGRVESGITNSQRAAMDYRRIVNCTSRARLMRLLSESLAAHGADFDDGLFLETEKGAVRISPSPDRAALLVETRSRDVEFSRELALDFEEMIKNTEKAVN